MRKLLTMIVFGFVAAPAWAAGYDDFLRAGEFKRVGNVEQAVASYTAALSAGDLAPAYVPHAYLGRAELYYWGHKCALALADLDEALKQRPNLLAALEARAHVHDCLGKTDAARADLDAMIAVAPAAELYTTRGGFNWFHGDFARAAEDYSAAAGLHNKRSFDWRPGSYSLVWYAISARRAQSFVLADFAAKAKSFDRDLWPGALVSFFLGTSTQEAVYREAAKGENAKDQKCEADFFIAEWQFAADDPGAKTLLEDVAKNCPNNSIITQAARTDLGRMP